MWISNKSFGHIIHAASVGGKFNKTKQAVLDMTICNDLLTRNDIG